MVRKSCVVDHRASSPKKTRADSLKTAGDQVAAISTETKSRDMTLYVEPKKNVFM